MADTWRQAWEAALTELELTVETTERLLRGEPLGADDVPTWTPPALSGPMPSDLVPRARLLLARQQELATQTASAAVGVRQKLALLDKLDEVRRPAAHGTPVYVDLTA